MKSKPQRETRQRKKPYAKPEIKQVQLKPEEAVLGNCKVSNQTASSWSPGNICQVCGGSLGS